MTQNEQLTYKQLPNEPNDAYRAFIEFCEMGNPRNCQRLADTGEHGNKVHLKYLMKTYKWNQRVKDYDRVMNSALLDTRKSALMVARDSVLKEAWEDYQRLLIEWRKKLENTTDDNFHNIVKSRKLIDDFARRTVLLPQSYISQPPLDESEETGPVQLKNDSRLIITKEPKDDEDEG